MVLYPVFPNLSNINPTMLFKIYASSTPVFTCDTYTHLKHGELMLARRDNAFPLFQGVGNNLGFTKRRVMFQLLKTSLSLLRTVILHFVLVNRETQAERTFI